jgi:hypothetical protein
MRGREELLEEISSAGPAATYAGLLAYALARNYNTGWAAHAFKEIFSAWPRPQDRRVERSDRGMGRGLQAQGLTARAAAVSTVAAIPLGSLSRCSGPRLECSLSLHHIHLYLQRKSSSLPKQPKWEPESP